MAIVGEGVRGHILNCGKTAIIHVYLCYDHPWRSRVVRLVYN